MILGHLIIEGRIKCLTGMHIGTSSDTIEIGGIDSPVVRNPVDRMPYIPGSSLKGKMRSLIERWKAPDPSFFNRDGGSGCKRHECDSNEEANCCAVCSIFGSTGFGQGNEGSNLPGRLIVWDGTLANIADMTEKRSGLLYSEAKMENAIDRVTAAAHPRTIERVPAGAIFTMKMVLRVDKSFEGDAVTWQKHGDSILFLLELLEKDGLGGSISRGYGQVEVLVTRFEGVNADNTSAGGLPVEDGKYYAFKDCRAAKGKIEYQEVSW